MRLSIKCCIFFYILSLQFFTTDIYAAKPLHSSIEQVTAVRTEEPPKKNKLALWSLILSGLGFLCLFIPYLSIASPYLFVGGIVYGIIALSKMKKNNQKGKGLAIAGLIIGGVSIIAALVAIAILLTAFS